MARRRSGLPLEKPFLIAIAAGFVAIALLLPLALRVDAEMDSRRPLYDDVLHMAVLQFREVRDTGEPDPLTVVAGETIEVGGSSFTPSAGVVEIEVRRDGVGYCVRGRKDDGYQTGWQCYDGSADPAPRGVEF